MIAKKKKTQVILQKGLLWKCNKFRNFLTKQASLLLSKSIILTKRQKACIQTPIYNLMNHYQHLITKLCKTLIQLKCRIFWQEVQLAVPCLSWASRSSQVNYSLKDRTRNAAASQCLWSTTMCSIFIRSDSCWSDRILNQMMQTMGRLVLPCLIKV